MNCESLIQKCIFSGNSADAGGGIYCFSSDPIIQNCTISRNTTNFGAGSGIFSDYSSTSILNTIIEGNSGYYAVYINTSVVEFLLFNDFYNNEGDDFYNTPLGTGLIITVNTNGDSCDTFYNIFLDPLFVDPVNGDFHLQWGSPCIDAGDPATPLDPDGTVSDIGAFYYQQ